MIARSVIRSSNYDIRAGRLPGLPSKTQKQAATEKSQQECHKRILKQDGGAQQRNQRPDPITHQRPQFDAQRSAPAMGDAAAQCLETDGTGLKGETDRHEKCRKEKYVHLATSPIEPKAKESYPFRLATKWDSFAKFVGRSLSEPDKGATAAGWLIRQCPFLQDCRD